MGCGRAACAAAIRFSSAVASIASQGMVSGSTGPINASGGSVSRTVEACIGLNVRLEWTEWQEPTGAEKRRKVK